MILQVLLISCLFGLALLAVIAQCVGKKKKFAKNHSDLERRAIDNVVKDQGEEVLRNGTADQNGSHKYTAIAYFDKGPKAEKIYVQEPSESDVNPQDDALQPPTAHDSSAQKESKKKDADTKPSESEEPNSEETSPIKGTDEDDEARSKRKHEAKLQQLEKSKEIMLNGRCDVSGHGNASDKMPAYSVAKCNGASKIAESSSLSGRIEEPTDKAIPKSAEIKSGDIGIRPIVPKAHFNSKDNMQYGNAIATSSEKGSVSYQCRNANSSTKNDVGPDSVWVEKETRATGATQPDKMSTSHIPKLHSRVESGRRSAKPDRQNSHQDSNLSKEMKTTRQSASNMNGHCVSHQNGSMEVEDALVTQKSNSHIVNSSGKSSMLKPPTKIQKPQPWTACSPARSNRSGQKR